MTVTSGLNLQTIPSDLAKNVKILNLDLGNNFIERSSDLKVSPITVCKLICHEFFFTVTVTCFVARYFLNCAT